MTYPWRKRLVSAPNCDALRRVVLDHHPRLATSCRGPLALLGAGPWGGQFLEICRREKIAIAGVYDDDPKKIGCVAAGYGVAPVCEISVLDREIPVVLATHRLLPLTERLSAMGFPCVWPLPLLSVQDPARFPPHPFYENLAEDLFAHRSAYLSLYDDLSDDKSRETLDAVIGFRLTLDPGVLRRCIESDWYFSRSVFSFSADEVFVDGGAFTGDSIRAFAERTGNRFRRIYAFEPDPTSFRTLRESHGSDLRIRCVRAGLHSENGRMSFSGEGGRVSALSDDGGCAVSVQSIDEALQGERATFIKLNIEGVELEALNGAQRTIREHRPKLAVAAYHVPTHLWQVPRLIRELWSGYRLFLRHHDGGVVESVVYARGRP